MTERQEQHVKTLQEMRNVMIEDDNWENLQGFIEAVTAGGMAIQRLAEQQNDDCISRKEAIRIAEQGQVQGYPWQIAELSKLQSVQPEPKTGHWIKTPKAVMGEGYMWYCDKCEYQVYQDSSRDYPSENYCPNCGCRMVEPQETETWNGYHGQITAPKGTFERIFNDADDDNDI